MLTSLNLQNAAEPWRPSERENNVWLADRGGDTVIVFVHGFLSDSRDCWYNEKARTYWPAMVRDAYPTHSIFLGGYKTGVFSRDYQLSNCADELWTALSVPIGGSRPVLERQRVVFIAHSLGGIVMRKLLTRRREELRGKDAGLLLMASPSLGSGWANAGAGLAQFFGNNIAELLQENSSLLSDLHNDFRDITHSGKLPGLHGMECAEDTGLVSLAPPVVSLLSAGQYFGETHRLPDTNHKTCVKPGDDSHPACRAAQLFLQQFEQHCDRRETARQELIVKDANSVDGTIVPRPPFTPPADNHEATQSGPRTTIDDPTILRVLGNASKSLLQWPQETAGQWLERPELDQLRPGLDHQSHTFTVLLGPPGSGKSALLARLGSELRQQGVALLALKADSIPRDVGELSRLDEWLGVQCPLAECVFQLAATRPVVLLIDQLDALADLMDLHSARLNMILALVNQVRGSAGVHVILSCREFEFKHDSRLSALRPKEIRLADPPWAAVQPIIVEAGLQPDHWPEETLEVLCRPQHLQLFLNHLKKNVDGLPAFRTYHAMLEQVMQKLVLPLGDDVMQALQSMAIALSEDEELWLPIARFEASHPQDTRRKLLFTHLLMLSPDGIKIGFSHQTVFDFIRARAFTASGASLAKHVLERQDALFVRPTLWSSLTYLREADRKAYLREFALLWDTPSLRLHVRYLLVSFLGQVRDPVPSEVGWLMNLMDVSRLGRKALKATEGSPAWFAKLLPRLRTLMSGSPETAWSASHVLAAAFAFDRDAAIALIESNWLQFPDRDDLTIRTLLELKDWDDRSCGLVECNTIQKVASDHRWNGLEEIAEAAPRTFTEHFWPVLRKMAIACKGWPNRVCNEYVHDCVFQLTGTRLMTGDGLTRAIENAVVRFARVAPDDFLTFVQRHESDDLFAAHRLLSRGLQELAPRHPGAVVRYLLGDPRRLAMDTDTRRLISAMAPHLDERARLRLEKAINSWEYRNLAAEKDAKARRDRARRNREDRLRLLRCFSKDFLSPAGRILLEQEERALPQTASEPETGSLVAESYGSPMTLEQMKKASDDDLLILFDELTDNAPYERPKSLHSWNLQGGSIQTSQVFGELAKKEPSRALGLLPRFQPGKHERYAASALSAVSQVTKPPIAVLISAVHDLSERGFQSTEFRQGALDCLGRLAPINGGLDDHTCELLESWLQSASDSHPLAFPRPQPDRRRSIVRGERMRMTSEINFLIMHALFLGYLNRKPSAVDPWREVLERHIDRGRDLATWDALAKRELHFLRGADRSRSIALVTRLLHLDGLTQTPAAVLLVASTHWWLPRPLIQWCLDQWQSADWESGPQAAAEIATVRRVFAADDAESSALVEKVLANLPASDEQAYSMVFGIASIAAEVWNQPEARAAATNILLRLMPYAADSDLADTILSALDRRVAFRLDSHLLQILGAVVEHPQVLRHGNIHYVVDALRALLAAEAEPVLVCRIATAMLDEAGPRIADISTRWAGVARELTEIAITLQRFPDARRGGLDLFERLMDMDVYSISDVLKDMDRRPT